MTEVLVVGGGSTGCGIARDLALRGVGVTQRDDLETAISQAEA